MKIVAVTGITGKTGKWFLNRLNNEPGIFEKFTFRAATRQKIDIGYGIETLKGDIADPGFCRKLCEKSETLLHIAGIRSSFPLLSVAAECGVKRFILVHTTGMFSKYKKAAKPYLTLEAKIRKLADDYGIAVTILRPTMIYGDLYDRNVATFIRMVDKLKLFPVINGARSELQPVYAKDLGDAYFEVLMNPDTTVNKSYNLSGGAPIALIDMLKTIGDQLGKKNIFVNVPFPIAYFGAWMVFILSFTKIDYREKVQRMIEDRVFSHEDATRDFGYRPLQFPEGVKFEISQYLAKERRRDKTVETAKVEEVKK